MRQTVLITGASGGIGLELAKLFAADRHDLVLVARSSEKLHEIAAQFSKDYGVQVRVIVKDLSAVSSCLEVYEELKREKIEVHTLVNNAGVGGYGDFWQTDWPKERQIIDLNISSLVYLTKLFLKDMMGRREGKILNVASTAAFQPGPLMSIYYATKAFVLSFTEALAEELRGTGITVSALCPGPTETGFREAAGMKKSMLLSKSLTMDALSVAQAGYEGLKRGKRIVVPGFKNRLIIQMLRVMPRFFVTRTVRRMQEARRK